MTTLVNQETTPVKIIGAALSFSPSYYPVLEQAKYMADVLGATLVLMHVGERTEEKERALNDKMKELNMDYDASRMIWMEGRKVDTILNLCKLNRIDLLVMGAKIKEDIFSFYIGSVARKISRKAKCSVLLITTLTKGAYKYNKIVVNGTPDVPNSKNAIATTLHLAERMASKEVYIVNELESTFPLLGDTAAKLTEVEKKTIKQQEDEIEKLSDQYSEASFTIDSRTIKGKPGFAVSKFAHNKKADLLVVPSPHIKLNVMDRIFTHDMEYILANLPCNLLIVYSKPQ